MGPRWLHRGNTVIREQSTITITGLQWGRGGYTAEIKSFAAALQDAFPLQWGRGGYTAEIQLIAVLDRFWREASMGPRWLHRGNPRQTLRSALAGTASMGPRWLHRGNRHNRPSTFRDDNASMGPRWLHRGNGPRPAPPSCAAANRFNGAAVVTPRK